MLICHRKQCSRATPPRECSIRLWSKSSHIYSNDARGFFDHDVTLHLKLMIAVLLHCFQHSSEERLLLKFEASPQEMENSHVGWLQISNLSIQLFIHMLEDGAVLEGKLAYLIDMFIVLFLKDLISNAQGFQQNYSLPIQKASLVFVPV